MKRFLLLSLVGIVCLLIATPAFADIVMSSAGLAPGFWNAIAPTATGNNSPGIANPNYNSSRAYWDHGSFDAASSSSRCNVGWITSGQMAGCTGVNGPAFETDDTLPTSYWSAGAGNGNYDPNFYLNNTDFTPTNDQTELELRITGYQGSDVFGWFEYNRITRTIGALHPLFTGGSSPETFGAVITSPFFGFYLTNGSNPNRTFYTLSSQNTADAGIQHFAILRASPTGTSGNMFRSADHFYVGVEDLEGPRTDFDYNDMVVEINQVPEPSAILLLGTVLAGCGLALRRKRR